MFFFKFSFFLDVQHTNEANIIRQNNLPSIDPPCTLVQGGSMEGMAPYIAGNYFPLLFILDAVLFENNY